MRVFKAVIALVAMTLVLTTCKPTFGIHSGALQVQGLTGTAGQNFSYASSGTTSYVTAGNWVTDENIRQLFWQGTSDWYADQETCATWNKSSSAFTLPGGPAQPGIATRIAPLGANSEAVRAITVTENIWFGGFWIFNVHLWNTAYPSSPFTLIGSYDMSSVVGKIVVTNGVVHNTMQPPPWHVCLRATGSTLSFLIWTGSNPKPLWTDPTHTFNLALPPGWDYTGYAGNYIGHLHSGQNITYTDQSSGPVCLQPDASNLAFCKTSSTAK